MKHSDHRPSLKRQALVLLSLLAVVAAIAVAGSLATIPNTDGWYRDAAKAPWSPPDGVFGPAWTTLYIMIAIAGTLIWRSGYRPDTRRNAASPVLWLFGVQLLLNAAWTPVFFAGYPAAGPAAWWLALLIIVALAVCIALLAARVWKHSKFAAALLVPYLLWVLFATTLNIAVIALN